MEYVYTINDEIRQRKKKKKLQHKFCIAIQMEMAGLQNMTIVAFTDQNSSSYGAILF